MKKNVLLAIFLLLSLVHTAFAAPKFLTIADIHYGSKNKPGYGQDTGNEFLKVAFKKFKQLSSYADFILVLGDLPTHSLFLMPEKGQYEKIVFRNLFAANHALKPMFYITGNNDSLTGNYQPFDIKGKSPLNYAADWSGACIHCDGLIIDDSHMRKDGYYSSFVIPGNKDIILIALNTIQWAKTPFFTPAYVNQKQDALIQLAWLEQQLKTHKAKQLLIAMHIPPGNNYKGAPFWHGVYLQKFKDLLRKSQHSYEQISLLTAHTHMDEMRKIDLKNNVSVYAYATPSISRNHYNNPGMKIFSLNKQMAIKNYSTFYTPSLNSWGDERYFAIGDNKAIFSQCMKKNLPQCLNSLSAKQICKQLEYGLFYGVKSDRVFKNVCHNTFKIN